MQQPEYTEKGGSYENNLWHLVKKRINAKAQIYCLKIKSTGIIV